MNATEQALVDAILAAQPPAPKWDVLLAGVFEEEKHPRHAKGAQGGGRFAPKGGVDTPTAKDDEEAQPVDAGAPAPAVPKGPAPPGTDVDVAGDARMNRVLGSLRAKITEEAAISNDEELANVMSDHAPEVVKDAVLPLMKSAHGKAWAGNVSEQWMKSSLIKESNLLKAAVAQEFGGGVYSVTEGRFLDGDALTAYGKNMVAKLGGAEKIKDPDAVLNDARTFAKEQYKITQAMLADSPGETVTLYRGMYVKGAEKWKPGQSVDLKLSSVSSFTDSQEVADSFGVHSSTEVDPSIKYTPGNVTVAIEVPKSAILANYMTGIGTGTEKEWLVLGAATPKAKVLKVRKASGEVVEKPDWFRTKPKVQLGQPGKKKKATGPDPLSKDPPKIKAPPKVGDVVQVDAGSGFTKVKITGVGENGNFTIDYKGKPQSWHQSGMFALTEADDDGLVEFLFWNEEDHPRAEAGTTTGGQFVPAGGGGAGAPTVEKEKKPKEPKPDYTAHPDYIKGGPGQQIVLASGARAQEQAFEAASDPSDPTPWQNWKPSEQEEDVIAKINALPEIQEAERVRQAAVSTASVHKGERGNYTPERTKLQHEAVAKIIMPDTKVPMLNPDAIVPDGEPPNLVLIIGPPGSGKTEVIRPLVGAGFDLKKFSVVDNDLIKAQLPEYEGGKNAEAVQTESADIADRYLAPKAINSRMNLLIDGVGKSSDKMLGLVGAAKKNGYNVFLYHVQTPPVQSVGSVIDRFFKKGRYVNAGYVARDVGYKPSATYAVLKKSGLISGGISYDNGVPKGQKPKLRDTFGDIPGRGEHDPRRLLGEPDAVGLHGDGSGSITSGGNDRQGFDPADAGGDRRSDRVAGRPRWLDRALGAGPHLSDVERRAQRFSKADIHASQVAGTCKFVAVKDRKVCTVAGHGFHRAYPPDPKYPVTQSTIPASATLVEGGDPHVIPEPLAATVHPEAAEPVPPIGPAPTVDLQPVVVALEEVGRRQVQSLKESSVVSALSTERVTYLLTEVLAELRKPKKAVLRTVLKRDDKERVLETLERPVD